MMIFILTIIFYLKNTPLFLLAIDFNFLKIVKCLLKLSSPITIYNNHIKNPPANQPWFQLIVPKVFYYPP